MGRLFPVKEFSKDDLAELRRRGISLKDALRQRELLKTPPERVVLDRPCTPGDGIQVLSAAQARRFAARYEEAREAGRATVFVPASGEASRMFQSLIGGAGSGRLDPNLSRLAELLLDAGGLKSGVLKALIPFHRYRDGFRTALEEHLVEAAAYASDKDGRCRLHFTVPLEHAGRFEALARKAAPIYEKRLGCRFRIGFSVQKASTDTLALDLAGRLFRLGDGRLLRAGGHGALLENLGALKGDIVFIKNVDNVPVDRLKGLTCRWKRTLAGFLVELQEEAFRLLAALKRGQGGAIEEAARFVSRRLLASERLGAQAAPAKRRGLLIFALDRPLRVCGVVRKAGDLGGGPFWVRDASGARSLQIVEAAQVHPGSKRQREIFASSTHFNPVDIVCGLRDSSRRSFDLSRYTDPEAVFVSRKPKGGRELLALERPGLWNGGMAGWNTVFVEVPRETFNPVKTVEDLLLPGHQETPAPKAPTEET